MNIENKTISVSKQAGRNNAGEPDITQPKTENSIRKISIPQEAVDLLVAEHQRYPNNPWMFPSPKTGEMYHPDSVVNIHKKILKDAGLEHLRFHDLRHTFATLALQNGVDVKTVSSMLGHFDADFTLRTYTHVTRQMQESAAEQMGGENDTIILSAALWTFRRVGHGVGQAGFHRFSRSAFPKMVYTFIGKILPG